MATTEPDRKKQFGSLLRLSAGIVGLVAVLGALVINARAGYSSWLTARVAADEAAISVLDTALRLDPWNGRAYDVRARSFLSIGKTAEAVKDFETAVRLRPHDYLFWLRLGYSRAKLGDHDGARSAYAMSLRLAPNYGRPHWYMGTLLVKMRLHEDAFAEFRSAIAADEDYFPHVVNTAWRQFHGDAAAVERAIQPRNPSERLALARVFLDHGKSVEAVNLFRTTGPDVIAERDALVADLLSAKQFVSAYDLWTSATTDRSALTKIVNGDFENPIDEGNSGFGWRLAQGLERVSAVHDLQQPNSGASSLLLDFSGRSNPSTEIISQVIVVQARTRYRLNFAARTENLVTGGLPMIVITDAGDGRVLAQSQTLPAWSGKWQPYSVELTTSDNTEAVVVVVKRQACSSSPCPAFGRVWVDSFFFSAN